MSIASRSGSEAANWMVWSVCMVPIAVTNSVSRPSQCGNPVERNEIKYQTGRKMQMQEVGRQEAKPVRLGCRQALRTERGCT